MQVLTINTVTCGVCEWHENTGADMQNEALMTVTENKRRDERPKRKRRLI